MRKIEKMNNKELVKLCAHDLENNKAWLEFVSRYEGYIYNTVIHECKNKDLSKKSFQCKETIKDLVQEVYLKLLQKGGKALKTFRGDSENSIYSYLAIISKNVVRNYIIKMQAKKRPPIDISLDDSITLTNKKGEVSYHDKQKTTIFDSELELKLKMLKEEIDFCLKKILTGKYKERNKAIYKLYFYNGYTPKEIASDFDFGLSSHRIANIISDSRQKLIQSSSMTKAYHDIIC